jgi:hypothetical protein
MGHTYRRGDKDSRFTSNDRQNRKEKIVRDQQPRDVRHALNRNIDEEDKDDVRQ